MPEAPRTQPDRPPSEMKFHFIKSNHFRVIEVHGAFGGLSPTGQEIQIAIYNERRPIPVDLTFPIDDEGHLGDKPINRSQREGIVREVEALLSMTPDAADELCSWLKTRVQEARDVMTHIQKARDGASQ